MTFVLIVAIALLALLIFSLKERVANLEWQLKKLQEGKTISATAPPVEQPVAATTTPTRESESEASAVSIPTEHTAEAPVSESTAHAARAAIPVATTQRTAVVSSFNLIAWLKDGFLVKMGALLFFLGVALFLSYAFRNNWVSPEMRILLGFVIAGVAYVLSWWRLRVLVQQGLVCNALGTAIVIATVFAAQFVYNLFNPTFALVLMVVAISLSVAVSMRYRSEHLALAGAGAGLAVPFLANVPEPSVFGYLTYLVVLTLSFLWVVYRMGWTHIILGLLIGIEFSLYVLYVASDASADGIILLFAGVFALIFYGAGLLSSVVRRAVSVADLLIVGGNALTLLYWIHTLVIEPLQPPVTFLVAAVAAMTAQIVLKQTEDRSLAYLHSGVAVAFIFVATGYLVSGVTLTFVLTAEVGFIMLTAIWRAYTPKVVGRLALLFALPVLASLSSFEASVWDAGWWHADALALSTITGMALLITAVAYERSYQAIAQGFAVLAWIYLMLTTLFMIVAGVAPGVQLLVGSMVLGLECAVLSVLWVWRGWSRPLFLFFALMLFVHMCVSLSGVTQSAWDTGWWHLPAWVFYVQLSISCLLVLIFHWAREFLVRDLCAGFTAVFLLLIPWLSVFAVLPGDTPYAVLAVWYGVYTSSLFGYCLLKPGRQSLLMLAALSGILSGGLSLVVATSEAWQTGIMHGSFVSLLMVTVLALGVTFGVASRSTTYAHYTLLMPIRDIYAWATGVLGVLFVWLSAHAVFQNESTAVSISLFSYVVVGLGLYVYGRVHDNQLTRVGGMVVLGGVIMRLIVVDVWSMEITWRVLTFAGIGILFLGTSFIESHLHTARTSTTRHDGYPLQ